MTDVPFPIEDPRSEQSPGPADPTDGTAVAATGTPSAEPAPRTDLGAMVLAQVADMVRLPRIGRRGGAMLAGLVVALWAASGFYRVQPDEQGVVLRFGRWVDTATPGVHYHWPAPIERVVLPKTTQVNQLAIGRGNSFRGQNQMLTGDENIVEADGVVFWRIRDPADFLFKVSDPEGTLRVAAESALREVIGQNPIQAALSDKRQQIADQTAQVLQRLLDKYRAGIEITQVQLLRIDPPVAVIDAFNDVQRARADQERARNEAEAYRNDVIPRARGEAEHIVQEAEAYREQVLDLAHGEAESFTALAAADARYHDVMARRLYLESVDEVLKHAGRVILDASSRGSGIVPYLPVIEAGTKAAPPASPALASAPSTAPVAALPAPTPTPIQAGGVQ